MGELHHHPKASETTVLPRVRIGERRQLLVVMLVTGVTMAAELAGGFLFGSTALLGDAFHMLAHFGAIGMSYAAIVIALRPASEEMTYRYWRAEVLATLFNGIVIIPLAAFVMWEAYDRWRSPHAIEAWGVLGVGGAGLIANIVSAAVLRRHAKHDMNVRGAFLHMLADSVSSVGVIGAGGVIVLTGWTPIDPLVAAIISAMILVWAFVLIRDACRVLLESAPGHVELSEIREAIRAEAGVADVHDLHVWTITSKMHSLTAHVVLREDVPVSRTEDLCRRLRELLDRRFDINHATLQLEAGNGEALRCECARQSPNSSG